MGFFDGLKRLFGMKPAEPEDEPSPQGPKRPASDRSEERRADTRPEPAERSASQGADGPVDATGHVPFKGHGHGSKYVPAYGLVRDEKLKESRVWPHDRNEGPNPRAAVNEYGVGVATHPSTQRGKGVDRTPMSQKARAGQPEQIYTSVSADKWGREYDRPTVRKAKVFKRAPTKARYKPK